MPNLNVTIRTADQSKKAKIDVPENRSYNELIEQAKQLIYITESEEMRFH